jgi:hypothetical protein
MRKSVGFFRFFMALITLSPGFDLEQTLKIRDMGGMTGSALTVFDRLMQEIFTFDPGYKLRMTITAKLTWSFFKQTRKTGGMGFVAGCTLTLDYRLMPNLPLERTPVMAVKTVTGKT